MEKKIRVGQKYGCVTVRSPRKLIGRNKFYAYHVECSCGFFFWLTKQRLINHPDDCWCGNTDRHYQTDKRLTKYGKRFLFQQLMWRKVDWRDAMVLSGLSYGEASAEKAIFDERMTHVHQWGERTTAEERRQYVEDSKSIENRADLSRDEWLEFRRNYIGGSDAAAILGLSNYASPLSVYADKMGMSVNRETSEAIRIGNDLEQYVADRFCEETGKKVEIDSNIYCHPDYHFIGADLDRRIVGENAGLECKTTSAMNKTNFADGELTPYYICQCYHYMNVMNFDRMYLAVLVLGKGFYWFTIEKNEEVQKSLLDKEVSFWKNYIEKMIEPDADGSDASLHALNSMREQNPNEIAFLPTQNSAVERYRAICDEIRKLEDEKSLIKNSLVQAMQTSAVMETANYKATYLPQTKTALDSNKLKLEFPDAYAACSFQSVSRVFRTSVKKNAD